MSSEKSSSFFGSSIWINYSYNFELVFCFALELRYIRNRHCEWTNKLFRFNNSINFYILHGWYKRGSFSSRQKILHWIEWISENWNTLNSNGMLWVVGIWITNYFNRILRSQSSSNIDYHFQFHLAHL